MLGLAEVIIDLVTGEVWPRIGSERQGTVSERVGEAYENCCV